MNNNKFHNLEILLKNNQKIINQNIKKKILLNQIHNTIFPNKNKLKSFQIILKKIKICIQMIVLL